MYVPIDDSARVEHLKEEIRNRIPVSSSFFLSTDNSPEVIEYLWKQAKFAYLDSPLPLLFIGKLFAYLSRFCYVPYCLAWQCAFLLGRDSSVDEPEFLALGEDEVLSTLASPFPSLGEMRGHLDTLGAVQKPFDDWPTGSALETSIFACSIPLFLCDYPGVEFLYEPSIVRQCQREMRRVLGTQVYNRFMTLLSFIRTAHQWTITHPEIVLESDVQQWLDKYEALSDWIKSYPQSVADDLAKQLHNKLDCFFVMLVISCRRRSPLKTIDATIYKNHEGAKPSRGTAKSLYLNTLPKRSVFATERWLL